MTHDNLTQAEQTALEQEAYELIGCHRKVRIRLGQIFMRLKAQDKHQYGHGHWQTYYESRFGNSGLSLRTAERYMRLTRKTEADSKIVNMTILEPGSDKHAVTIENATNDAHIAVKQAVKPQHPYRLALRLTPTIVEALDRYWRSSNRTGTERKILMVLISDLIKHGYLEPPFRFPREAKSA